MKYIEILLTTILILITPILVFAQTNNYKITYRHCFQNDTTRVLIDTIGQEAILLGNRYSSSYNFSKFFGQKSSTGDLAKEYDEIFKQKKSGLLKIHGEVTADSIGNIIFWDKTKDSIYLRQHVMTEYLLTTENLVTINWNILKEYKSIDKYFCQKATSKFRGRQYTAWFTTKVPIVDGPWKFKSLPGLILDLYDDRNQVKIYAVSVEFPTNEQIPDFQPVGRKASLTEYFNYPAIVSERIRRTLEAVQESQPNLIQGANTRIRRLKSVLYNIEMWAD